jgi:hypothetical protein
MFNQKSQRGQALILIVFGIVGLLAITALAVDSGNAFAARRRAQSAADNAALSAALAKVNSQSLTDAAYGITRVNGFADSTVTIQNPPGPGCDGSTPTNLVRPTNPLDPYNTDSIDFYIQVVIRSSVNTYFGPVIGVNQVKNCVQAIARAKPLRYIPPFYGNAVVALSPEPDVNSYDSGNSNAARWTVKGGGIFANQNAYSKNSNSVTFPDGHCVTAVGTASNFNCPVAQNMTDYFFNYPQDVTVFLPPTPPCDGTAFLDTAGDGKIHEEVGFEGRGSRIASFAGDYAPGVYCITDAGGNIHSTITGTGVTFYILDTDFTMKFNGGGSLAAQAPTSGTYKGVLIFAPITDTPCTQNIDIRGNGSTPIVGSIIMPSACIDYRGNGTGDAMDSMMVGYYVTSNGTGDVTVTYNADNNYKFPDPPVIELTK